MAADAASCMIAPSQERFQQLTVLFHEALSLPAGPARESCLDARCGSDHVLRREIANLLASDAAIRLRAWPAPARQPNSGIGPAPAGLATGGTLAASRPAGAAFQRTFRQAWGLAWRNKAAVAAVTLCTLLLVAGVLASWWETRAAGRRLADARELVEHLQLDLQRSLANPSAAAPAEADMARHFAEYLDRLSAQKIYDPALRTEVGEAYAELGAVLGSPNRPTLGDPAKAEECYRKAVAVLEPVAAANPGDPRAGAALARSELELGRLDGSSGNAAEGLRLLQQAAREYDGLTALRPFDFDLRGQAAFAFQSLGAALSTRIGPGCAANLEAASDALRSASEQAKAAAQLRPQLPDLFTALAASYIRMGGLAEACDRPAAIAFYRQAIAVLDQIPARERDTAAARNARSSALLGLGWNLGTLHDYRPALAALEEARRMGGLSSGEDLEDAMSLYFRAMRNRRGLPLQRPPVDQPSSNPVAGQRTPGGKGPMPAPSAPNALPSARFTGNHGEKWPDVPNRP